MIWAFIGLFCVICVVFLVGLMLGTSEQLKEHDLELQILANDIKPIAEDLWDQGDHLLGDKLDEIIRKMEKRQGHPY